MRDICKFVQSSLRAFQYEVSRMNSLKHGGGYLSLYLVSYFWIWQFKCCSYILITVKFDRSTSFDRPLSRHLGFSFISIHVFLENSNCLSKYV